MPWELGLKVNAAAGNNTKDLNKKMKEVMGFFDRDIMARTCRRFCSWMEAVVAAYGNFMKFVNSQYISLLYFFYFNKIGSFSAVLCPFLWNFLKFQKYRCHPAYQTFF
jgi:hypothetical protein